MDSSTKGVPQLPQRCLFRFNQRRRLEKVSFSHLFPLPLKLYCPLDIGAEPTMNSNNESPQTITVRVCTHCNCTSKKTSKTVGRTSSRIACPVPGCTSTFGRRSDLARHQKSIHGPKTKCAYTACAYMTGRVDKMAEHMRKIHQTAGEFWDCSGRVLPQLLWGREC